jgi:hypothetical protein
LVFAARLKKKARPTAGASRRGESIVSAAAGAEYNRWITKKICEGSYPADDRPSIS